MTRDDIIHMAQEAGIFVSTNVSMVVVFKDQLDRFATLVSASEREACAKICDNLRLPDQPLHNYAVIMCRNEIKARGRT